MNATLYCIIPHTSELLTLPVANVGRLRVVFGSADDTLNEFHDVIMLNGRAHLTLLASSSEHDEQSPFICYGAGLNFPRYMGLSSITKNTFFCGVDNCKDNGYVIVQREVSLVKTPRTTSRSPHQARFARSRAGGCP